MLKYFTSKGYVAAGINYSLRTDENTVNLYQMSQEIKQSIPVIKEKAAELGYNLDEMAISGGSAGGALALLYAYRDADSSPIPVKLVFEGVGPPSFEPSIWLGIDNTDSPYESDEAAEASAAFASIMTGESITAEMMRNGEYKKYVDEISPYTHITKNSVPTLAAYGTYDKVVPFGLTKNLLEALKENNVPHDFIEFKRSGHGLQNDPKEAKLYFEKSMNIWINICRIKGCNCRNIIISSFPLRIRTAKRQKAISPVSRKENEHVGRLGGNEVKFMKIFKRILLIVVLVVIAVIVAVLAFLSYRNGHYYKFVKTDKPIEAQYTALGTNKVSYVEFDAGNDTFKKYEIWFPSELKESSSAYPLVIMANGTGIYFKI